MNQSKIPAQKPQFSVNKVVRISARMNSDLASLANETDRTESEIVRAAIREYVRRGGR